MSKPQAGRELDAFIAEKIMGIKVTGEWPAFKPGSIDETELQPVYVDGPRVMIVPAYSTSIEAAWEVVKEIKSRGYDLDISWFESRKQWACSFTKPANYLRYGKKSFIGATAREETETLAICLAALKAMEVTP